MPARADLELPCQSAGCVAEDVLRPDRGVPQLVAHLAEEPARVRIPQRMEVQSSLCIDPDAQVIVHRLLHTLRPANLSVLTSEEHEHTDIMPPDTQWHAPSYASQRLNYC